MADEFHHPTVTSLYDRYVSISDPETEELAFSVDTHLFRELGSLLVGRDSTALVELIKNSYDADATHVVVHGEQLRSTSGQITVSDDGSGMSYEVFTDVFLRIAGRSKEDGDRRSPIHRRRYTGAKGIGRISAYKLAEELHITSVPEDVDGVQASINWKSLETSGGDIQDNRLVEVTRLAPASRRSGTTLTLAALRLERGRGRVTRFLRELRATRPEPALFTAAPAHALNVDLLIPEIAIADAEGPPFVVELTGDLDPGDPPWASVLEAIDWVIEIDARQPRVHYRISPTASRVRTQNAAVVREFTHERDDAGPRFVARILVRAARAGGPRLSTVVDRFIKDIAGVRVYMEGFQVVPYGLPGNDWLEVDRDAVRRNPLVYGDPALPTSSEIDERIYQLSSQNYIGAVFLQEDMSHGLEMVVNREGFLPSPALDEVQEVVRRGIDLGVRVRAALAYADREDLEERRAKQQKRLIDKARASLKLAEPEEDPTASAAERVSTLVGLATQAAADLRATSGRGKDAQPAVEVIEAALVEASSTIAQVRDEQAQLRVLASVGTQFGAFIHEVNALLAQSKIVLSLLDRLVESTTDRGQKRQATEVRSAMTALVAALERQAIYLTDTIGADSRRRRSQQRVQDRVSTARRLLEPVALGRGVEITEDVPSSVKTPAMFPAEVNVILTNLLSNAIKAASPGGRVHISALQKPNEVEVRVENTGVVVARADRERWFRPFETTTTKIDDILGQGMGLGLPLTRRIVEEYGGEVRFVDASPEYATAVQVLLPTRGR